MSEHESDPRDVAAELSDTNDETVLLGSVQVQSDGRITIPKQKRERYGIEEGDWVDAVLSVEGEIDE